MRQVSFMTINNPDVARLIEEQLSTGRYTSADEVVLAGLKLLQERENGKGENATSRTRTDELTNLAALAAECTKDIPASEWDKFPADFAQNIDHYLYGTPKRS
jgi:putative addiction module CopG family antidote